MDLLNTATNALLSGVVAAALGTLMTAPRRQLVAAFVAGAAARLTRDLCTGAGIGLNAATAIAAAAVVIIAVAYVRRDAASPVVMVSAVLPLGAPTAMLMFILNLVRVSTASGEDLTPAVVTVVIHGARVFATTLAIAMGLAVGMWVARRLWPAREVEGG